VDISIQDVTEVRKSITVSIPKEEVAAEEKEVYKEFKDHARIPGFRPGKAPLTMIKQKFAKEIADELVKKLQRKAYEYIGEKSGLNLYSIIKADAPDLIAGADTTMTFVFDVWPTITLPEYKGIKVDVPVVTVTEEDIDAEIKAKQAQHAKMEKVERAAKADEYVRVSYVGKIGDELIEQIAPDNKLYGTQKNTWEKAGAKDEMGVKAVVEGVVGMKPGDTKTVEMTFPKDFEVAELAGKKATYDMEMHEVREQVLPELDEAFFAGFKAKDLDSFKKAVEQEVTQRKKLDQMNSKREQIARFIDQNTHFELPESAVDAEKQQILRTHIERMLQHGVPQEQLEEQKEKLFEEADRLARENIKMRLALLEIAKQEKIEISKEDIWAKVVQMAYMRQVTPDKIVSEFQKDQGVVDEMKREVLVVKTLDFLCDKADSGEVKEEKKAVKADA